MNLMLHFVLMTGLLGPVQPPAAKEAPAAEPTVQLEYFAAKQEEVKPPTSLEQAIAQALVNHPDMRLVEAELRVAEAKLAQARINVSQKVTEDFHRLEKDRADVEVAKANLEHQSQLFKKQAISQTEMKASQQQLANAKSRLAATENSWKLIMGNPATPTRSSDLPLLLSFYGANGITTSTDPRAAYLRFNVPPELSINTIPSTNDPAAANILEQLKTHLTVKVKLENQAKLNLEQAFKKVTEGAGLKVRVKLPVTENKTLYRDVTVLDLEANDFPLHTWLQLIVDEVNNYQGSPAAKRYDLYVREYGLLLTKRELAPPDAITVQDLLKQSQYEKAAKAMKKAETETPKK